MTGFFDLLHKLLRVFTDKLENTRILLEDIKNSRHETHIAIHKQYRYPGIASVNATIELGGISLFNFTIRERFSYMKANALRELSKCERFA